jgi:hypothetical protein
MSVNVRMATKLGQKVITKLGKSKVYRLHFDSNQEALDFCEAVRGMDPVDNLQEFVDTCEAIIDPEVKAEVEAEKEAELRVEMFNNIDKVDPRFYREEECIYFKETGKISLPERLLEEMIERVTKKEPIEPLLNFWRLAALNPDPKAREGLYRFIMDLNLVLTDTGMFVGYRNVVSVNSENMDLMNFVAKTWLFYVGKGEKPKKYRMYNITIDVDRTNGETNTYNNNVIVKIGKKEELDQIYEAIAAEMYSFTDGAIGEDDYTDFEITDYQNLGNLNKLYKKLIDKASNESPVFTDQRTQSMDIRIGTPVQMDREACDANENNSCSRGLHIGSERFMSKGSFGNAGLVCLINPRNVVAVPLDYGNSYKMRCCEYLPIGIAEYKNNSLVPLDVKTLDTSSMDYINHDIQNMAELLKDSTFEDAVKHKILPIEHNWIETKALLNKIDNAMKTRTVLV